MQQLTCDPIDALNEALCHEKEGQAFYLKAAQRTTDSRGIATFRSLADDAKMHAEIIQRQLDAFNDGHGWALPECVFDCQADLDKPLYPRGKDALDRKIRPDDSDVDAILFAIGIESDSFDLYTEHAKTATDPQARSFYEYLADEARSHFDLLRLNYESLAYAGGWVD
jgi:rubrerythrin